MCSRSGFSVEPRGSSQEAERGGKGEGSQIEKKHTLVAYNVQDLTVTIESHGAILRSLKGRFQGELTVSKQ